jgi:NADH-quinone oxidoreductase subunit H
MVYNGYYSMLWALSLSIPYFLVFFLISTAKAPFDIVEAETEIIMGYHVEYSGFLFGLFVLIEYFHVLILSYLLILFIV